MERRLFLQSALSSITRDQSARPPHPCPCRSPPTSATTAAFPRSPCPANFASNLEGRFGVDHSQRREADHAGPPGRRRRRRASPRAPPRRVPAAAAGRRSIHRRRRRERRRPGSVHAYLDNLRVGRQLCARQLCARQPRPVPPGVRSVVRAHTRVRVLVVEHGDAHLAERPRSRRR